ncbi:unnamed protein product [Schistosoma curassoni]|uniref:NAM-associated domain-containing protein n=1 Tax=Schistosoma curassoni TaxID=6186 RepID=A0A183KY71_9TREM|nr:unnamed protein product [Schistosoma curassoni]
MTSEQQSVHNPSFEFGGVKKVLGHKEWITVDTLDKIQERRNKKAAINTSRTTVEKTKAQAEYTEVNKQVKRSIKTDKRKYVEDLATTAENAAREGNMRQLYDMTKKLYGNNRKPERPVKSKEGKVGRTLQKLLNRPAPLNPPNIEAAHTNLPTDVGHQQLKKSAWPPDNQEWQSSRTKQHSSTGTESRRSGNCKDTPHSLQ